MEPYDKYNEIFYKYIGPFGDFVGVNMTNPNYRPSFRTWFWIAVNFSAFISLANTFLTGDIETVSKSVIFIGLGIQGLTKYAVLMNYSGKIYQKVGLLEKVYLANRDPSTPAYQILMRWSHYCLLFAKYASIPVSGSIVIVGLWPFGAYLVTGHLDYILPVYLPFFDAAHVSGMVVNYVHHSLLLLLASSGTCGADFMIVILVLHLWPMCLIWEHMFAQLNKALLQPAVRSSVAVKVQLRNCIHIHKEMAKYLEDVSDIYYYVLFAEISTCAQCLITILFCLNTLTWYPLYSFWTMFFSKLLAYCSLGTIAETATDHIYGTMLHSNWYLLPNTEKRYMLLMLSKAQKPTTMKAGTMKLNLDTFVSVLKSVYSIGMLLAGN